MQHWSIISQKWIASKEVPAIGIIIEAINRAITTREANIVKSCYS